MFNSRLIQLISRLDRKEMTRFRAFADSPYFNKHPKVRALVGYLSIIYPGFTHENCDRELLFSHLFPNESFNYQKLFLIASYTSRLLESFFEIEAYRGNCAARRQALLDRLRQDKQEVLYQKKLSQWAQDLEEAPLRNGYSHFETYLYAKEADMDYRRRGKHERDPHLQQKQNALECFFISEKLRDSCEMLIRNRILKVDYQPGLLPAILAEVQNQWEYYSQKPAVMVYYRLYNLLLGEADAGLEENLSYLQEHDHRFPKEEQQQLYNTLLNYCIWQINRGDSTFHAKALRIIRWQLQQELIFHGEYLPEWHYKNIVTIGLRAGEHDWVFDFIERYKARLNPEVTATAYPFNLAAYYYSRGQLGKVQELLAGIDYQDQRYYLAIKSLLLRTYFDLEEYEALRTLSDAFRQHMKRNKLMSDDRNQALSNLFHLTQKTARLLNRVGYESAGKIQQEWQKLKGQVQQSQLLIHKEWLLGRLEELEEKKFKTKKAS
jgi:hypothetical protein